MTIDNYQICCVVFGLVLYGFAFYWKARHASRERDIMAAELEKATIDQVEAMRTLSAFRRQYHDGTSMFVNEVKKLRREVSRLKRPIHKKKTGKDSAA